MYIKSSDSSFPFHNAYHREGDLNTASADQMHGTALPRSPTALISCGSSFLEQEVYIIFSSWNFIEVE